MSENTPTYAAPCESPESESATIKRAIERIDAMEADMMQWKSMVEAERYARIAWLDAVIERAQKLIDNCCEDDQ